MIQHTVKLKRAITGVTLVEQDGDDSTVATIQPTVEPAPAPPELLLGKIASAMERIEQKDNTQNVIALAIELSRVIVEKMIGGSAELQQQRLYQIIRETEFGPETAVGIHLHPSNLGFVSSQLKTQPKGAEVNLIADESIGIGECRVEFKDYDYISSIEHQLEHIENQLSELNDE